MWTPCSGTRCSDCLRPYTLRYNAPSFASCARQCTACARLPSSKRKHRACLTARASSSGSPDQPPGALSVEDARKILGLPQDATFEQTMQAKNKLLGQAESDSQKQLQIELAYDILLMRSMKARISGELQPARDVRFADVPKYRPAPRREKTWQEKLLEKLPGRVRIETSPTDGVAVQTIIFGTLAASTILQEFFLKTPPGTSNAPSLQLGLALAASIYFLRDGKKLSLVRAGGLSTAGLLVGTIVGSALQSWLRVDIVPIGELHSPAVLVGEFSIVGMWLAAYFLA